MGDDVLVNVDNVIKRFCRSLRRSLFTGLQDPAMAGGGDCRRAALMCPAAPFLSALGGLPPAPLTPHQ